MKPSPTISIVLTTCNGERFLRSQLDSLYRQTQLPSEVVVSDDGSTDGTLQILEEYRQQYGLRYELNPERHGVNGNFCHALRMSSGDFVCFCDQDDIWLPQKVETLYNAIKTTDASLPVAVSSSRIDVDAQGREIGRPQIETTGSRWQDTFLHTGCSQGCTMMLNRCLADRMVRLYDTNPLADSYLFDVLASVTAALFGQKLNLPDRLMLYRHHDHNVVDRLQTGHRGFWQRVQLMPTYYPFLLDYRIHELALTDALFAHDPLPADRRLFLHRMTCLDQASSIWQGLRIIWSLREVPASLKIKTTLLTPVSKCLKCLA